MSPFRKTSSSGFTLIEAIVSVLVMTIGFLGLASLQIIGVRTNRFGDRMAQASALATDLAENMENKFVWPYNDSRLTPLSTVTTTDPLPTSWDLGILSATSYKAEYSDRFGDSNATNAGTAAPFGALGTTYSGQSSDVDKDGTNDFVRYWNVYEVRLNPSSSAQPDGKIIQIIVRWKEPGFGYRQVTTSAFKPAGGSL